MKGVSYLAVILFIILFIGISYGLNYGMPEPGSTISLTYDFQVSDVNYFRLCPEGEPGFGLTPPEDYTYNIDLFYTGQEQSAWVFYHKGIFLGDTGICTDNVKWDTLTVNVTGNGMVRIFLYGNRYYGYIFRHPRNYQIPVDLEGIVNYEIWFESDDYENPVKAVATLSSNDGYTYCMLSDDSYIHKDPNIYEYNFDPVSGCSWYGLGMVSISPYHHLYYCVGDARGNTIKGSTPQGECDDCYCDDCCNFTEGDYSLAQQRTQACYEERISSPQCGYFATFLAPPDIRCDFALCTKDENGVCHFTGMEQFRSNPPKECGENFLTACGDTCEEVLEKQECIHPAEVPGSVCFEYPQVGFGTVAATYGYYVGISNTFYKVNNSGLLQKDTTGTLILNISSYNQEDYDFACYTHPYCSARPAKVGIVEVSDPGLSFTGGFGEFDVYALTEPCSFPSEYGGEIPGDLPLWEWPQPDGGFVPPPGTTCSCTPWENQGCGLGDCESGQMYQTRTCNYPECGESRCVIDPICSSGCSCTSWTNQGCGMGACSNDEMYQTRSCNPPGCDIESRCAVYSECTEDGGDGCSCTPWENQWCNGICDSGLMYQTRTCNPPGCDEEQRCAIDPICSGDCSCTQWTNQGCGIGGCAPGQMYQTRVCSPNGCEYEERCIDYSECIWENNQTIGTCKNGDSQLIMRISNYTNAFGEFWNQDNYPIAICYDDIFGVPYNGDNPHECTGSNKVVGLSDVTDAYGEIPEINFNSNNVCYGDLQCRAIVDNAWVRVFGGEEFEYSGSIQKTSDEGYIVVGTTASYGNGLLPNAVLIKLDSEGNIEWYHAYDSDNSCDIGLAVYQTSDGGYAVTGIKEAYDDDLCFIKTSADGTPEIEKVYSFSGGNDKGYWIEQTSDGYVIFGETSAHAYSDWATDLWMVKLDSSGNIVQENNFDVVPSQSSERIGHGNAALNVQDGYIIAGASSYYNSGPEYDIILIKTDYDGNLVWDKRINSGSTFAQFAEAVEQAHDGGYIIVGSVQQPNNRYDIFLIKTDENGNVEWNKTFGGSDSEFGLNVKRVDNGYILFAKNVDKNNLFLIKTDENGNVEWNKTFGFPGDYSGLVIASDGYVFTGTYRNDEKNVKDIIIVKTNSTGDLTVSDCSVFGPEYKEVVRLNSETEGNFQIKNYGYQQYPITICCKTSVQPCQITQASISPNCAGGNSPDCEPGESITLTGQISGDCSNVDFFQIDAQSSDGLCNIQYNGGDIQGIYDASPTISDGQITGTWTIPSVPQGCQGKVVSAYVAGLYSGGPPGSGNEVSITWDVDGSFKFFSDTEAPTTTISCDGSACSSEVYLNGVEISFTCTDNYGCDKTYYRIDGGIWNEYTSSFSITDWGTHTIDYYSTDLYGNVETIKSQQITVDTPPVAEEPMSFTGTCEEGQTITLVCKAHDDDNDLSKVYVWAGECDKDNCFDTRSWATGQGTIYYQGYNVQPPDIMNHESDNIYTIELTINQPAGTGIAATCLAEDSFGIQSDWNGDWTGNAYPLCVVDECTPPTFNVISVNPNPTSVGTVTITFTSSLPLDSNPDVKISIQGNDYPAQFVSQNGNEYVYSFDVLQGYDGEARIKISGSSNNCEGFTDASTFDIDTQPPTTSISCNNDDCLNTYNTDVTIELTCSDPEINGYASGCDKTYYCIDSSNECTPSSLYTGPITLTEEETAYIRFYSNDSVGNSEGVQAQMIRIDKTLPTVTIDYQPKLIGSSTDVTFTAMASDDNSGLDRIEIYLDIGAGYELKQTCTSSPCSYIQNFAAGTNVGYKAKAIDKAGNVNETSGSFTVCKLQSVSLSPNCGDDGCEKGESLLVNVQYSGACPSLADSNLAYIQVDAEDESGTCKIEAIGGDIKGINITCSQSPCTAEWLIPDVPAKCRGKTVNATVSTLRDNVVEEGGKEFDLIRPPDLSGQFTFKSMMCAGGESQVIMRLSDETDAFGGVWNSDYPVVICYDEIFGMPYYGENPHSCHMVSGVAVNKIISLSSDVDGYGEVKDCYLGKELKSEKDGANASGMFWTGNLTLKTSKTGVQTIKIRANADCYNGCPIMSLWVGNTKINEWQVQEGWNTYEAQADLVSEINISFDNDYFVRGEGDRNLYIDYIGVAGERIEAETNEIIFCKSGLNNYPVDICYGDLQCIQKPYPCTDGFDILSLNGDTNAKLSIQNEYSIYMCCRRSSPIIYNVEHQPRIVSIGQDITFSATVTDVDGVDAVKVCKDENCLSEYCEMNLYDGDNFDGNYTCQYQIQAGDPTTYYVYANDSFGFSSLSGPHQFSTTQLYLDISVNYIDLAKGLISLTPDGKPNITRSMPVNVSANVLIKNADNPSYQEICRRCSVDYTIKNANNDVISSGSFRWSGFDLLWFADPVTDASFDCDADYFLIVNATTQDGITNKTTTEFHIDCTPKITVYPREKRVALGEDGRFFDVTIWNPKDEKTYSLSMESPSTISPIPWMSFEWNSQMYSQLDVIIPQISASGFAVYGDAKRSGTYEINFVATTGNERYTTTAKLIILAEELPEFGLIHLIVLFISAVAIFALRKRF